jgi:hypothetical protein
VHQVAERAEGLVDVGADLGPVDLVEVDPVGLQPAQAVLDLPDDPAPGVAEAVARTTSSRRPWRALPTIRSDSPWE